MEDEIEEEAAGYHWEALAMFKRDEIKTWGYDHHQTKVVAGRMEKMRQSWGLFESKWTRLCNWIRRGAGGDVLISEMSVLANLGDGDTINWEREYEGNWFLWER